MLTDIGFPEPTGTYEKVGNFLGRMTGGSVASAPIEMAARARYATPLEGAFSKQDQVRMAAETAYQRARQAQVVIRGEAVGGLSDELGRVLQAEGYASGLHPRVTSAMQEVGNRVGTEMSLEEAERVRRILKNAAASQQPDERRIVMAMIDKFDDFVKNLTPEQTLSGATREGVRKLGEARQLWSRMSKGEQIEGLIEAARNRASQYSGSGFENALRTEFRQFTANQRNRRFFTPDEWRSLIRVSRGGTIENFFRYIGKLAPTGVVSGGVASGAGYAAAGPAGAVAVPVAGLGARSVATRMTLRNAELAADLARTGGELATEGLRLSPSMITALGAAAPTISEVKPEPVGTDWQNDPLVEQ
jgi:hypothetical protein